MVAGAMRERPSVPWPGSALLALSAGRVLAGPDRRVAVACGEPFTSRLTANCDLAGPGPGMGLSRGLRVGLAPGGAGPLACAWVWVWVVCVGLGYSVMMTSTAPPPPITCAAMN